MLQKVKAQGPCIVYMCSNHNHISEKIKTKKSLGYLLNYWQNLSGSTAELVFNSGLMIMQYALKVYME